MTRIRSATALRRSLGLSTALGMSLGVFAAPAAGQETTTPTTPTVQAGTVTFADNNAPMVPILPGAVDGSIAALNVNVGSAKAIVNWATFDISTAGQVNFTNALGGNVAVLNRVTSADVSQIAGQMNAPSTVSVWLINPNGILFGNGAAINVGGLVASTLNIADDNAFLTTNSVNFGGPGSVAATAAIGDLGGAPASIVTNNGVLALVAPQVNLTASTNSGTGATAIAIATDVSLTTSPGGPLSITLAAGTQVAGNSVAGAMVGNRIYVLVKPQDSFNALLNVSAAVTNATVTPTGAVVLSGGGLSGGLAGDTASTGAANAAGTTGTLTVGSLDLATPLGGPPAAPATTGVVRVDNAIGDLNVGTIRSATGTTLTASGAVNGATVTLGAGTGTLDITAASTAISGSYTVTAADFTGLALSPTFVGAATRDFSITDTVGGLSLGAITAPDALSVTVNGGGGLNTTGLLKSTNAGVALTAAAISLGGNVESATSQTFTGPVTLAANATLTSTGAAGVGDVTFTNIVAGANALTVSTAGLTTFGGTVGAGAGNALTSLAVTTGPTSVAGNVTTTGGQSYTGELRLQANTTLSSTGAGDIVLASAVIGARALTVSTAGLTTFGGTVGAGAGNELTSLAVTAGPTSVAGDVTTTGGQSFAGELRLQANTVLTGATADLAGGVVGNNFNLTLAISGQATLGAVNGVALLESDAAGTLVLNADVNTNAAQLYRDPVRLANTIAVNAGANPITFEQTLVSTNETQGLTIAAASPVAFNGDVGGAAGGGQRLAFLTANGAARTGGAGTRSIRTVNAQTYGGLLTLGLDTVLTGSTAAFNGGVAKAAGDPDRDLTLNFTAASTLVGANLTGIRNLTTDAGGGTTLNGTIATSGTQSYNDPVTLAANTTVTSTGAGAAANISFNGTVGGAFSLTGSGAGTVAFNGAVGPTVTTLTTTGAAATAINANVTTTGAQTYGAASVGGAAAVTVASTGNGAITFDGTLTGTQALTVNTGGVTDFRGAVMGLSALTTDAGGGTTLTTGTVGTTGAQTYGDALTLTQATTLSGTVANFTGGVIGGTQNLTLVMSGNQQLGPAVTGINALTTDAPGTTIVTGNFTTAGAQFYGDAVTLAATATLSAGANTITFNSTLAGDNETRALTLASAAIFNGDVGGVAGGGTRLLSLTANGPATLGGTGTRSVRTVNAQTYGAGLTLGTDAVLTGTTATFTPGVAKAAGDPDRDLTLNFTGAQTLSGPTLTGIRNLATDTVGAPSGTTSLGGLFSTSGTQTFNDTVALVAATTLRSSGVAAAGDIALDTIVGNAFALTIETAGTTALRAGAGGLRSITTDQFGTTMLSGNVVSLEQQTYNDPVRLATSAVLASSGAGATGDITLAGSVDGTTAADQSLLVTTAGTTRFGGAVGFTTRLDALTTDGGGTTRIDGGVVTTENDQTYNDLVEFGADAILTGRTLFGATFIGNGNSLTLRFDEAGVVDDTRFANFDNFDVGGRPPAGPGGGGGGVGSGLTVIAGTLTTGGSQFYRNNVRIAADATRTSGGAVSFGGTVDGTTANQQNLTINAAGTTTFGGAVGETVALEYLRTNGAGPVAINGGAVTTFDFQRYGGPVTLGQDTALRTTGATVTFDGTVAGPLLAIQTGAASPFLGAVSFGGAATLQGLSVRAGSLTTAAGNQVSRLAADVTGDLTFATGGALTIDEIGAVRSIGALAGVRSAGTVNIAAGGLLTLARGVTGAGAGVTLRGIGITQLATGAVVAGATPITLDGDDGTITLAAALTTTNAGAAAVRIIDATDVLLHTITTGAAGTVTLGLAGGDNLSGTVMQAAGTVITAGTLQGVIGGAATLGNANAVGTLAALSANGLTYRNATALTVTGPVDGGTGNLSLQTDTGALTLAGDVRAIPNGTVSLVSGGPINQTAGIIAAGTLTGSSVGGATLNRPGNTVGTLAGFINTGAGGFDFVDSTGLAITATVDAGTGPLVINAPTITFPAQTLRSTGNVTLTATGAIAGATVTGAAINILGGSVDIGAVTGASLDIGAQTTLRLGTGDATGAAVLTANGDLTVTTSLTAGTGARAISGGNLDITAISSTNNLVEVRGLSTRIGQAIATNGALDLRSDDGPLFLGIGRAGTTADLVAIGPVPVGAGPDTGTLTIGTSLTTGGAATLTSTGTQTIALLDAGGAQTLTTTFNGNNNTNGDINFTELRGAGAKTLTSVRGIGGGTIAGAGGVTLVAATNSPITVASIGAVGARVDFLTVNGGNLVTIGAAGSVATNLAVANNIAIGQTGGGGAATGALNINGAVTNGGTFTSTTIGATDLDAVESVGALAVMTGANGALSFTDLTGAGAKTLASGGSLTGNTINGAGAVTLAAATGSPLTITGAIGGVTPVGAVTVNGGSAVTFGTAGVTPTAIASTGAVSIGATLAAGSLTINGTVTGTSFASRSAGTTDLDDVTSGGAIGLTTTGVGDIVFGTLSGAGAKTIASARGITGGLILGTGAVTITAGAAPVTITGTIGAAVARAASLTLDGGTAVTIGSAPTAGTIFTTGNVAIGQTTAPASLTINGAVDAGGTFAATATGLVDLDQVTAGTTLAATSAGGAVAFDRLVAPGATTITAATSITGNAVDGGGALRLVAGTASPITLGTIGIGTAAASLTVSGGAPVTFGAAGATGTTVNVAGATRIGQAADGAATGALTVNGNVVSGGTFTSTTTGGTTLADLTSTGALSLTTGAGDVTFANLLGAGAKTVASGGAITGASIQGAGAVTLTAAGASPVTIGSIGATGAPVTALTINGGSAVTIGAVGSNATNLVVGGATAIGQGPATGSLTVNGATSTGSFLSTTTGATQVGAVTTTAGDLGVTAGGAATIGGAVSSAGAYRVRGSSVALGGVAQAARGLVDLTATAGTIAGGPGLTLQSNSDGTGAEYLALQASGAINLAGTTLLGGTAAQRSDIGVLAPAGPVTLGIVTARSLGGTDAARAFPATPATLTTAGAITVGGAIDVQRSLALTSTGGAITLAGTTVRDAGAAITLTTTPGTGAITAASLTAPAAITVTAGGAATVTSATGGSGTIRGTAATLTTGAFGAGTLAVTSTAGKLTLGTVDAGATTLNATGDVEVTTRLTAVGATTIIATGAAIFNGATTGAPTVAVSAADVQIGAGGSLNSIAGTVTLTASRAVSLGAGAATGFALDQAEVDRIAARDLIINAGTNNVAIAKLAFAPGTGSTRVDVLTTARIDVTDAVTGAGSGRSFRFGDAANTPAATSVIRVVATPTAGGRLLFDTANLELRASRIGAGQAAGFLDTIGFAAGSTALSATQVADAFVGNPNSSLYNATFGGVAYTGTDLNLITARSLTVRYGDYALFQNTATPGLNGGVTLGSQATPSVPALTVQGPGATANDFALFGTINGINGSATSVLGSSVLVFSNTDPANTRVNGCLVGSGSGCLSSVVSQPLLNIFDASRADVLNANDDLLLPFDPLVGTNNEALFSGVGLLDASGVTATECAADQTAPGCEQQKEPPQ